MSISHPRETSSIVTMTLGPILASLERINAYVDEESLGEVNRSLRGIQVQVGDRITATVFSGMSDSEEVPVIIHLTGGERVSSERLPVSCLSSLSGEQRYKSPLLPNAIGLRALARNLGTERKDEILTAFQAANEGDLDPISTIFRAGDNERAGESELSIANFLTLAAMVKDELEQSRMETRWNLLERLRAWKKRKVLDPEKDIIYEKLRELHAALGPNS
jgi:hypothetical protein